ncbi:sortase [Candidatus Microgenomates bacterium]|nr:sortase [Candidatus Microgenomates bacterium]
MSFSNVAKNHKTLLLGLALIFSGVLIFLSTFFPLAKEEVRYAIDTKKNIDIKPVSTNFGIVIPKIGANAKVIANVNPNNEKEYQLALSTGVAHARGTVFPGQIGNVFIFAHSAGDMFQANRYNAVFYLLGKLEKGDEIDLYYDGKKYKYLVEQTKIVESSETSYLNGNGKDKTLTLMTCWPAGTTLKRQILIAQIAS